MNAPRNLPTLRPDIEGYQRVADRDGLRLFPIDGDLMAPTVTRGDFLMVRPLDRFDGEGVYVLDSPFGPSATRARALGGTVRLIPDNPLYAAETVTREAFNADVIAKAVFRVTVLDHCLVPPALRPGGLR